MPSMVCSLLIALLAPSFAQDLSPPNEPTMLGAQVAIGDAMGDLVGLCGKSWAADEESGFSANWASLPTPVKASVTLTEQRTLVAHVHLSSVTRSNNNTLGMFRLLLSIPGSVPPSERELAVTNLGLGARNHLAVSFFGQGRSMAPGTYEVELQYQTKGGHLQFPANNMTVQSRSLIIESYQYTMVTSQYWSGIPEEQSPKDFVQNDWFGLPTPMQTKWELGIANSIMVAFAFVSRVTHDMDFRPHIGKNAFLRINLAGEEVAQANVAPSEGWGWEPAYLQGSKKMGGAVEGEAAVQYQEWCKVGDSGAGPGSIKFTGEKNAPQARGLLLKAVESSFVTALSWNMNTSETTPIITSTAPGGWLALPTPMAGQVELPAPAALSVFVSMSSIKHSSSTQNVKFRLVVDGRTFAETNAGTASGWEYGDVSFQGHTEVLTAGSHQVEVQLYNIEGLVTFWADQHSHRRSLIITQIKNSICTP